MLFFIVKFTKTNTINFNDDLSSISGSYWDSRRASDIFIQISAFVLVHTQTWFDCFRTATNTCKIIKWKGSGFIATFVFKNQNLYFFKVISLYRFVISWKCKLTTVMSYKADVSSVSPSSEHFALTKG